MADLKWMDQKLQEAFELKTEIVGADAGVQTEARVLNRVIHPCRHVCVSTPCGVK